MKKKQPGIWGQRYDRAREWQFDGGLRVPASSSPLSVQQQLAALHHADHEQCYIANSLKTAVRVEAIVL